MIRASGLPACLALLLACSVVNAADARPVELSDLRTDFSGASLRVSPDGSLLAVERGNEVWIVDRHSGRKIVDLGHGCAPLWSPTENRVAFYSDRANGFQLWQWSTSSGKPIQITNLKDGIDPDIETIFAGFPNQIVRFSWSPDGKHIAFASRVARRAPPLSPGTPLVLNNSTSPGETTAGVFKVTNPAFARYSVNGDNYAFTPNERNPGDRFISDLFSVDVASGVLSRITSSGREYYSPVWTADSRSLLAVSLRLSNGVDDALFFFSGDKTATAQIVRIEARTGKELVVVSNAGAARLLQVSPDGSKLSFVTGNTFWDPTRTLRVMPLDRPGTGPETVQAVGVLEYRWQRDSRRISLYRDDRLTALNLADKTESMLSNDVGRDADAWDVASDGAIIWLSAGKLVVLAAAGTAPKMLLDFNPARTDLDLGLSAEVRWRNKAGDKLTGRILYPPRYVAGRKYALIVDAYPLTTSDDWTIPLSGNQAWASKGYVVFRPGPRSPHTWMNSPSQTPFYLAAKGPSGWNAGVDDLISGVDDLIRRGIADRDRMCLIGHSNGGGMVSYVITQTSQFKCAVIVSPAMADWIREATLQTGMRGLVSTFSGGFNFNERPDVFLAMSSVFKTRSVKTPTLIAVGDQDFSFLLNAIEIYNGIRDTGTAVTLLRYPHEEHLFKPDAMKDFWQRETAFVDHYLQR